MRADDPAQDSMVEAILDALQAPHSPAPPPTPATMLGALQWTTLNPITPVHCPSTGAAPTPTHPLSRQTDVDSPQSAGALGRPLPGGDVMTLPASVLGGPSGRRPSPHRGASMTTSLAARKAHNAELAEAYPGTGMGGQLTLPPAALGPNPLTNHHVAAYGEDGAQVSPLPLPPPPLPGHHAMHAFQMRPCTLQCIFYCRPPPPGVRRGSRAATPTASPVSRGSAPRGTRASRPALGRRCAAALRGPPRRAPRRVTGSRPPSRSPLSRPRHRTALTSSPSPNSSPSPLPAATKPTSCSP